MYNSWFFISEPNWNNEFSYQERIALWSQGKIYIPSLIEWAVDNLEIWTEIAFEEVANNTLVSCKGLKNFIHMSYEGIPIYIFDNHNHALFFRYRHTQKLSNTEISKEFKVIHIDQHSDIKPNINTFNVKHVRPSEVFGFTNYACNVGNFITSAKDAWIVEEIMQIRSEHALHSIPKLDFENYNYILDIDVDFRDQKSDEELVKDLPIIHQLIKNSCLITIATSPYFLDQNRAIQIIKKILN